MDVAVETSSGLFEDPSQERTFAVPYFGEVQ